MDRVICWGEPGDRHDGRADGALYHLGVSPVFGASAGVTVVNSLDAF
jgi:hypothetical protein